MVDPRKLSLHAQVEQEAAQHALRGSISLQVQAPEGTSTARCHEEAPVLAHGSYTAECYALYHAPPHREYIV